MGINPFNQPDVESAKIETRALTAAYEETGKLPAREPVLVDLRGWPGVQAIRHREPMPPC